MKKDRLAIFVSGNGTNAEAIMEYFKEHSSIEIALLLSNNPQAFALQRAKKFNVPTTVFTKQQFAETDEIIHCLNDFQISHIILAGFLLLVPDSLVKAFPDKIVNIHPALLPKYGGKGMYGMKVHEAVRSSGDLVSGITIHLVNEKYDEGEILAQETIDITPEDTPTEIADKVHSLEHRFYPRVIESWLLR